MIYGSDVKVSTFWLYFLAAVMYKINSLQIFSFLIYIPYARDKTAVDLLNKEEILRWTESPCYRKVAQSRRQYLLSLDSQSNSFLFVVFYDLSERALRSFFWQWLEFQKVSKRYLANNKHLFTILSKEKIINLCEKYLWTKRKSYAFGKRHSKCCSNRTMHEIRGMFLELLKEIQNSFK